MSAKKVFGRWRAGYVLVLFLSFLALGTAAVGADSVIRGYSSSSPLQVGLIVALDNGNDKVKIAPANDPKKIFGVVIDPNESPITLTGSGQTFIATSGKHPVLVTTENGKIKSGDYISMSTVDGIGAHASADQPYVLGRATEDFDGQNKVINTVAGLKIGRINVDIVPKGNPLKKTGLAAPESLRKVSEAIAGNPVGTLKIYLALLIVVSAAVVSGILVSTGVRSGIVSIGRNPLSKKSILRGLMQSIIMAILIFIIGLFGVYLLLKL